MGRVKIVRMDRKWECFPSFILAGEMKWVKEGLFFKVQVRSIYLICLSFKRLESELKMWNNNEILYSCLRVLAIYSCLYFCSWSSLQNPMAILFRPVAILLCATHQRPINSSCGVIGEVKACQIVSCRYKWIIFRLLIHAMEH